MSYIIVRQESPVLIIGQAPALKDDRTSPLSGRTGHRLATLMDMDMEEFLTTFDRANLFNKFPGKAESGGGDAFPLRQATTNAFKLMQDNPPDNYRAVILLGKNVAKAFNIQKPEFFEWGGSTHRPPTVVIPHPSGLNRWWNELSNEKIAREFLNEMADQYFGETYTRV